MPKLKYPRDAKPATAKLAPERLVHSISETCAMLGLGRTTIYNLIREGALRPIKIKDRTLVPRTEIERLAAGGVGDATA